MRTWIGEEQEGDVHDITLFVESDKVELDDAERIARCARARDICRIYLGAGRKNVLASKSAVGYLKEQGLEVVIETDLAGYKDAEGADPSKLVLRVELPDVYQFPYLSMKLDNLKDWCAVSTSLIYTDTSQLKNGMYETDKEVDI